MTFLGIFFGFLCEFLCRGLGGSGGPGGWPKSRGPTAPRLLVFNNQIKLSFMFRFSSPACHVAGLTSPSAYTHTGEENAFDQK